MSRLSPGYISNVYIYSLSPYSFVGYRTSIFELFATQYGAGIAKAAPKHDHDLLGSMPL